MSGKPLKFPARYPPVDERYPSLEKMLSQEDLEYQREQAGRYLERLSDGTLPEGAGLILEGKKSGLRRKLVSTLRRIRLRTEG
jgi:hypothetical protein